MSNVKASSNRPVRVVLGMMGTDVHSKGIRTLSLLLRDAGFEIIYAGEHNSPEGLARTVISEDAEVIGVSFSSGAYLHYVKNLTQALDAESADDVSVMVGGLIHKEDHPALIEMGVTGIFGPGSTMPDIIDYINKAARSAA